MKKLSKKDKQDAIAIDAWSLPDSKLNRQEYNIKILNRLYELVAENPELRFGQILEGFDLYRRSPVSSECSGGHMESEFYTESKDMFERIKS